MPCTASSPFLAFFAEEILEGRLRRQPGNIAKCIDLNLPDQKFIPESASFEKRASGATASGSSPIPSFYHLQSCILASDGLLASQPGIASQEYTYDDVSKKVGSHCSTSKCTDAFVCASGFLKSDAVANAAALNFPVMLMCSI